MHSNSQGSTDCSKAPLALPSPERQPNLASLDTKVDVQSQTIKLENLGPMVVNSDGTLSRIANWPNMTHLERERTLRLLSARNKIRLSNEEKKQIPEDRSNENDVDGLRTAHTVNFDRGSVGQE